MECLWSGRNCLSNPKEAQTIGQVAAVVVGISRQILFIGNRSHVRCCQVNIYKAPAELNIRVVKYTLKKRSINNITKKDDLFLMFCS